MPSLRGQADECIGKLSLAFRKDGAFGKDAQSKCGGGFERIYRGAGMGDEFRKVDGLDKLIFDIRQEVCDELDEGDVTDDRIYEVIDR